jgi:hypothetical protein
LFRITVKAKEILNSLVKGRLNKMGIIVPKDGDRDNDFKMEESCLEVPSNLGVGSSRRISITDGYLFNAEGVSGETFEQLLNFLGLPGDKLGMDKRFREAMEGRTGRP